MTYKKKQVGNQPYYADFIKGDQKKPGSKTAPTRNGGKPKKKGKVAPRDDNFRPTKSTMYGKPETFRPKPAPRPQSDRNDDSRPYNDVPNNRREWSKPPKRDGVISYPGSERPAYKKRDDSRPPFNRDNDRPRRDDSRPPFNRDNDRPRRDDSRPPFNRDNDRPRRDDSRPPFNRDNDRPRRDDSRPPFNRDNDRPRRDDSRPPFNRDNDRPRRDDSRPPFNRDNDRPRRDDSRPPFNRDNDRPRRDDSRPPFNRDNDRPRRDDRPPFNRDNDRPRRDDDRKPGGDRPSRDDRPPFNRDNDRPRRDDDRQSSGREENERKPYNDKSRDDRPDLKKKDNDRPYDEKPTERPVRNHKFGEKRYIKPDTETVEEEVKPVPRTRIVEERGFRSELRSSRNDEPKPFRNTEERSNNNEESKSGRSAEDRRSGRFRSAPNYNLDAASERYDKRPRREKESKPEDDLMRLNRYIANAGVCSRRDADTLIESGQISVNGKTVVELGYKVVPTDVVKYGNRVLNPEKIIYLLLNKPKGYITTTDDPDSRDTVMDLISGACKERVYPVGRLDRNTTGLLLFTNDGELAEKLMHPSNEIQKIYQVELDKPITTTHFEAIKAGIELEDGPVKPDDLAIVTPDAEVVGIEIHSGRNRIVRRIFENFGYEVQKLDRTVYAGLNKKELPRGNWRFLTEKEVIKLKYLI